MSETELQVHEPTVKVCGTVLTIGGTELKLCGTKRLDLTAGAYIGGVALLKTLCGSESYKQTVHITVRQVFISC